jgi:ABC-type phosphate/phosphonate transport system substrate-binding protein
MFASLPMYDLPEVRAETDALWSAIAHALAQRGIEAPETLARGTDLSADWLRPDLLLSQTCGLPYVRHLRGRVALVGAVHYDLPDCAPGAYRSRVVVRSDDPAERLEDLRGRTLAMNSGESQSGAGALRGLLAPLGPGDRFFGCVLTTGAHLRSIRAVAEGLADAAAVDAVTFELARRHVPAAAGLRVLLSTPETPGLPLVTRKNGPAETIREAVAQAVDDVGAEVRSALLLRGVVPRRDEDFDGIAAVDRLGLILA